MRRLCIVFGSFVALVGLACSHAVPGETPPAPSLSDDVAARSMTAAAWVEYCDRIKAVGLQMLEEEFPQSEADRAEGFRHLARTVSMGLQWEVDFADTDFPAFYRHNDDVTKWGGPNVDNSYIRTHIDGRSTYRLSGDISTIHDLIVSTANGDMHDGKLDVAGDFDSSELGVDDEGRFELMIGPDVDPEKGIRTAPDHVRLEVRQYFYDWETETPGTFHLERVSPGPDVPSKPTPDEITARLDAAATWVERTIPFWRKWLADRTAATGPNEFRPPAGVPGGSGDIYYGGGHFDLAPDQALLIETDAPQARYWSFQWYTNDWFESPDFGNRQSSLNGRQARVDADGKVRIVVSGRDPGVQNWIDVEGYRKGMITYRWIWSKDAPKPTAKVIPLTEIRDHLPADTPVFDAEARREQIAVRRRHVESRFRR